MANKPLPYRPAAVPTHLGWAHEKTGEQLTSHRNLKPAEGTEGYQPNNRKWMAAYNEGPADVAPANTAVPVITGTTALGDTLTSRPLAHGREHLNRRSRISGRGAGLTSPGPMLQPT